MNCGKMQGDTKRRCRSIGDKWQRSRLPQVVAPVRVDLFGTHYTSSGDSVMKGHAPSWPYQTDAILPRRRMRVKLRYGTPMDKRRKACASMERQRSALVLVSRRSVAAVKVTTLYAVATECDGH